MKLFAAFSALLLAVAGNATAEDDEARNHLLHDLGGPFFVSRDKVQDELQLSDDQKKKLLDKLSDEVEEARKFFEKLKELKAGERAKEMQAYRQRASAKLEAFLKDELKADQIKRFQQLKLQYDMPTIMVQPEVVKELKITDEQIKKFKDLVYDMQKEVGPLMKKAQSGGNLQDIRTKVIKSRLDCQEKIEALLSDDQKRQWKEMIGKPFVIW